MRAVVVEERDRRPVRRQVDVRTVLLPGGANIPFTVPGVDGVIITFSYDGASHVLTVTTSTPGSKPDLSVAAAYWIDPRTIAYPINRLGLGVDPAWLRFRLHWGSLAVEPPGSVVRSQR